eukprot:gene8422-9284_t
MFVHELSSISAERYYLISEIEQKAMNYYKEMDGDQVPPHDDDLVLTAVYTLWDLRTATPDTTSQSQQAICEKVQAIYERGRALKILGKYQLIVIDTLLPQKEAWLTSQSLIQDTMNKLSQRYQDDTNTIILIAIADQAGSLPGLETCQTIFERLHPGMFQYPLNIAFLADKSEDMLGHDPSLEPNANSDVFQLACWSIAGGLEEVVDRVKVIDPVQLSIASRKKVPSLAHSKKNVLLPLIGLLGLLLAYLAFQYLSH